MTLYLFRLLPQKPAIYQTQHTRQTIHLQSTLVIKIHCTGLLIFNRTRYFRTQTFLKTTKAERSRRPSWLSSDILTENSFSSIVQNVAALHMGFIWLCKWIKIHGKQIKRRCPFSSLTWHKQTWTWVYQSILEIPAVSERNPTKWSILSSFYSLPQTGQSKCFLILKTIHTKNILFNK